MIHYVQIQEPIVIQVDLKKTPKKEVVTFTDQEGSLISIVITWPIVCVKQ